MLLYMHIILCSMHSAHAANRLRRMIRINILYIPLYTGLGNSPGYVGLESDVHITVSLRRIGYNCTRTTLYNTR